MTVHKKEIVAMPIYDTQAPRLHLFSRQIEPKIIDWQNRSSYPQISTGWVISNWTGEDRWGDGTEVRHTCVTVEGDVFTSAPREGGEPDNSLVYLKQGDPAWVVNVLLADPLVLECLASYLDS